MTPEDHARVAQAIAEAESRTSGEIFCVVAGAVSSYRDVSLGWAAAAALILPIGLIPLGFEASWLPGMGDSWEVAQLAAREINAGQALGAYALLQAALFLATFLLTRAPPILRLVTPAVVRRARVRRAALRQFLGHGLHETANRTGVLIFVALADHQVEIIADEGIHALVDDALWVEAVDVLTRALREDRIAEGFAAAVALTGGVLARHFPPGAANADELPNRLVEI